MPLEGSQIGRFAFRLLGRGGMGEVYLAEDEQSRRQVAIKVIQTEYADPDATRLVPARGQGDRSAATILTSCHSLTLVRQPSMDDTDLYGHALLSRRHSCCWMQQRRNTALPSPQDVGLIVQHVVSALQYAHNRQIVHQDVKPSNFLIRRSEEARDRPDLMLADFGVAKSTSITASVSQAVRGTPAYMAPEQVERTPVAATDQYALAIMAYDLLTGHPPFQGGLGQVMYQHLYVTPQLPSKLNPRLPADVDTVLLHALAKKP